MLSNAWHVPESIPVLYDPPAPKHQSVVPAIEQQLRPPKEPPSLDSLVAAYITACLIDQGYMRGKLIQLEEIGLFRWEIAEGSSRPCNIVQL